MKACEELTKEDVEKYRARLMQLRAARLKIKPETWFDKLSTKTGYAHYTFEGTVSAAFLAQIEGPLTEDDIIMLVDDGFSHFGAYCRLDGNAFSGKINTD